MPHQALRSSVVIAKAASPAGTSTPPFSAGRIGRKNGSAARIIESEFIRQPRGARTISTAIGGTAAAPIHAATTSGTPPRAMKIAKRSASNKGEVEHAGNGGGLQQGRAELRPADAASGDAVGGHQATPIAAARGIEVAGVDAGDGEPGDDDDRQHAEARGPRFARGVLRLGGAGLGKEPDVDREREDKKSMASGPGPSAALDIVAMSASMTMA